MNKLSESDLYWIKKYSGIITENTAYKDLFASVKQMQIKFLNISTSGGKFEISLNGEILATGELEMELYEPANPKHFNYDHISTPMGREEYLYKIFMKDKDGDYHTTTGRYDLDSDRLTDYGYSRHRRRDIDKVVFPILNKWIQEANS